MATAMPIPAHEQPSTVILQAIPFFLLTVVLDAAYCSYKKLGYYRFNDSINSLSLGTASRLIGAWVKFLGVYPYQWLFRHYHIYHIVVDNWWSTVLIIVAIDFCYYVMHRSAHNVNLFWGGHKVHHSSEEYNFTTALRQGAFEPLFGYVIYLPLSLFFDSHIYMTHSELNAVYQYWVHNRHVKRMPAFIEFIFSTPSHHRVHHACNPKYIDKNFGGFLIIWDRIFGTFEPESETVVFGDTHPLHTWDPVWHSFHHYVQLVQRLLRFPKESLWSKVKLLYKGPGYSPKLDAYFPVPDTKTYVKYDPPIPQSIQLYVAVQYVAALVAHLALMMLGRGAGVLASLPLSLLLLLSLAAIGRLIDGDNVDLRTVFLEDCKRRGVVFDPSKEQLKALHPSHPFYPGPAKWRPNIWLLEISRLVLTCAYTYYWMGHGGVFMLPTVVGWIVMAFTVASVAWLQLIRPGASQFWKPYQRVAQ